MNLLERAACAFDVRAQNAKATALRTVERFADCTDRDLNLLAAHMDLTRLEPGWVLTREGHRCHTYFVLLEGGAVMILRGAGAQHVGPGTTFDESSMLGFLPARATIVATHLGLALVMSRAQFRVLKSIDSIRRDADTRLQQFLAQAGVSTGTAGF